MDQGGRPMTPDERATAELDRVLMSDALRALAEIVHFLAAERIADIQPRLSVRISALRGLLGK